MVELLVRIACCPQVDAARRDLTHPCKQVVDAQPVTPEAFHLPEPWNGALRTAPLLFLSSNPAIDPDEDYPVESWPDQLIENYFTHRFGGGTKDWTKGGNRARRRDGSYTRPSPFWSAIRARARELFEREVVPGVDFALTEVVHCKSLRERGVAEAAGRCAALYLRPVLQASAAVVVVALGRVAERHLRGAWPFSGVLSGEMPVEGRNRVLAVLPHPNAHQHRTFAHCFATEDLAQLRMRVRFAG